MPRISTITNNSSYREVICVELTETLDNYTNTKSTKNTNTNTEANSRGVLETYCQVDRAELTEAQLVHHRTPTLCVGM